MIPSVSMVFDMAGKVYQRGLVIDSQPKPVDELAGPSVSKGIGD